MVTLQWAVYVDPIDRVARWRLLRVESGEASEWCPELPISVADSTSIGVVFICY